MELEKPVGDAESDLICCVPRRRRVCRNSSCTNTPRTGAIPTVYTKYAQLHRIQIWLSVFVIRSALVMRLTVVPLLAPIVNFSHPIHVLTTPEYNPITCTYVGRARASSLAMGRRHTRRVYVPITSAKIPTCFECVFVERSVPHRSLSRARLTGRPHVVFQDGDITAASSWACSSSGSDACSITIDLQNTESVEQISFGEFPRLARSNYCSTVQR